MHTEGFHHTNISIDVGWLSRHDDCRNDVLTDLSELPETWAQLLELVIRINGTAVPNRDESMTQGSYALCMDYSAGVVHPLIWSCAPLSPGSFSLSHWHGCFAVKRLVSMNLYVYDVHVLDVHGHDVMFMNMIMFMNICVSISD